MRCPECRSTAVRERPERTAQGYRRFRCLDCAKQFNERSAGLLNRTQYPSDVIALVVLWRLRYKLSLRDLAEMFLIRGFVFSHEAVRDWEAKLTPALAKDLRQRRKGKVGRSWYVGFCPPASRVNTESAAKTVPSLGPIGLFLGRPRKRTLPSHKMLPVGFMQPKVAAGAAIQDR